VGVLNHANVDALKSWLADNFSISRFNDVIEHRQQITNVLFALADYQEKNQL